MKLAFRTKLLAIVAVTTFVLASVVLVYAWLGFRQASALDDLEGRMVPKLELGPRLESDFEHLRQSMQEAVAAQDPAALDATIRQRDLFVAAVTSAGAALAPEDAAELRHAIRAYYDAAHGVSRRMLRGETGEPIVDALAAMQAQQHATEALIQRTARLDRRELSAGFRAVRGGITTGTRYALVLGVSGLLVVLLLSSWVGAGVVRSLALLSNGVARFATGDFRERIPVTSADELGKLTREVNQMAESRARSDWLTASLAGLSDELRVALGLDEVALRVIEFLATRLGAVAGALLLADDDGGLTAVATYAGGGAQGTPDARRFAAGEGLPGQAAASAELLVVDGAPADYLTVRSGLGEGAPRTLVFVPLARNGKNLGVIELALFKACDEDTRALLRAVREMIAIALEVARSRGALQTLLEKSQRQADLLAAQEEELRATNGDLVEQQDELRRANEELEVQRQALSIQNTELEAAREDLVEKAAELARVSAYKSQFLANMSHELRTPLNSMLLLSHLLAENDGENLTPKQVEHAKTINHAGKDLLGLINQVLDLAKIEAGRQEVDLGEFRLDELFDGVRQLFAASAQQKGLAFRVEVAPGLPETLVSDRRRLERIVVNLLGNALKFTEHGAVTLRVFRPQQAISLATGELDPATTLAIAVSDTGIGIPRAAQERIFVPFEQAEARTDRRYGGTGLGLAIARESALLLGGELLVESEPGVGSTFTCYLPENRALRARRRRHERTEPRAHAASPANDDRAGLAGDDAYLLVVEDDATFAEQLVELIHARGLKAVVTGEGHEALRLAHEQRPRGIILDVKLPDIDGWTVMERLRHDAKTRSIPVHFISGMDTPERALSLGAVGYLTKPASPQELVAAIRLLTRPPSNDASLILVVEDNLTDGNSIVLLLRTAGFAAEHVASARAALEAVASRDFACIVLDLGLPDMDGLGLLESLRERARGPVPPVIVHTGRKLTRDEVRRVQSYAQTVVLKDGHSATRLIDEVRLFVQHLRDAAPRHALAPVNGGLPDVSLVGTRILVADDDMRTVYALSALLRGKGADVLVAESGREALEILGAHPEVNAVLMDVMMPEMDGYEALRRLRADARFRGLPAIALTAKAMKGERERCLAAGASDYLAKPVDPGRLLTTLQLCLGITATQGHGRS